MPVVYSHWGCILLILDVGTLDPLRQTWVALTIDMLRCGIMYPMAFDYVLPALVAVLAERTFKIVFASVQIGLSTDTINCVKW
jgi:hypothetical protein